MTAKTDFLENNLLNHILRNIPYTSPTTVFAALFTTDTDDAGGGTEVPTSGGTLYIRQSVVFDAPVNGKTQNTALIVFPTAGASWGTVTHFAIFDAVSGGNMVYQGKLTNSQLIGIGDDYNIPIGDIKVQEL